jgi:hypothetical protein
VPGTARVLPNQIGKSVSYAETDDLQLFVVPYTCGQ